MDQEDIIREWIAGRLSTEELDEKIKDREELESLKKIILGSKNLGVREKRTKAEAWDLLASQIEEKDHSKVVRLKPYVLISIAASLTLIVVAAYLIFMLPETVNAPKGEHTSHILPDGSQVWLNADSKISYRDFGQQENRKVTLRGEAYFDVREGGSFEVTGEYGTVRVLGTSFNVSQREGLRVSCFRGSVEVTSSDGKTVRLKAGNTTLTKEHTLTTPARFNAEKEASWLTGDFYFDSASFEQVLAELERQFNVDVIYDAKDPRTYTGYFNNRDLDEALQLIFQPMSLSFRKDGSKIYVE
ncbi:MAG TPA: FecR domain-containing protein [Chryseolinea sp.]|nr:FecR domain-containing protein [Chryseolinea sp.]